MFCLLDIKCDGEAVADGICELTCSYGCSLLQFCSSCPVATYYEPCLPAALNGNDKPSPECCAIVRNMGQTWNGAKCMCAQAHAQTFGAPFQNSATMPIRCFGANYANPSGCVCRRTLFLSTENALVRLRPSVAAALWICCELFRSMMLAPLVFLVTVQTIYSFISCAMDQYLRSKQLMTCVLVCVTD